MAPISSKTGSPMKTSSSLNVEEDVTKAKKSRLAISDVKTELPDYDSASEDDQEFPELKVKKEEEEDDNEEEFPSVATTKPAGRETLRATRSQTSSNKGSSSSLGTGDETTKRSGSIHDRLGDQTGRRGSIHDRLGERGSVHDRLGENTLKRPLSSTSMRSSNDSKPGFEVETDVTTLGRRQKQIEYGKNTPEYVHYAESVPRPDRKPFHPKTPNMHRKYSRRAWDGLVKQWRLNLHCWSQKAQDSGAELKMELGESAASLTPKEEGLNDSFTSESTNVETDSTSSSISAAFSVGVSFANQVLLKVEPKLEKDDDDDGIENDALDTTMTESSQQSQDKEGDDKLGTSWADEVEEEYYEGSDGGEGEIITPP